MPQRKDPDIPVRIATAVCSWPGARTEQVEQLVTRRIEEAVAQNQPAPAHRGRLRHPLTSMPGLAIVWVQLATNVADTRKQFSDINLKLMALDAQLPQGAGPIQFNSDFGDTAALMLTVASPPVSPVEIDLRARTIAAAMRARRAANRGPGAARQRRVLFPQSIAPNAVEAPFRLFAQEQRAGVIQ